MDIQTSIDSTKSSVIFSTRLKKTFLSFLIIWLPFVFLMIFFLNKFLGLDSPMLVRPKPFEDARVSLSLAQRINESINYIHEVFLYLLILTIPILYIDFVQEIFIKKRFQKLHLIFKLYYPLFFIISLLLTIYSFLSLIFLYISMDLPLNGSFIIDFLSFITFSLLSVYSFIGMRGRN